MYHTPHLYLNGLFGMVYEHIFWCFILEDPSLGFLELFQATIVVACGYIPKLVALVMGVNRLLAMEKNFKGFILLL